MKTYTTGAFAKLANVTERTIRSYDQIGLLKPSFVLDNGYRQYTEDDLLKLQRIISLKNLGFSLEEIFPMTLKDDQSSISESIDLQLELIDKKIKSLSLLKETLKSTSDLLKSQTLDWNRVINLLQLSQYEEDILEQYRTSKNLSVRISLHDRFSINKIGWFPWLFSNIDFSKSNRILEVGCGDGKLWLNQSLNLRNREVFLSDSSKGMIDEAKQKLGDDFSYMCFECESIPFKRRYFDIVIANHVLFYLKDLNRGLEEIKRVLVDDGTFYCSTYGMNHMKEISELVQEYDPKIVLSRNSLYNNFGLENGKEILSKYFSSIDFRLYEDCLEVDESEPLLEYIMSCHGNQNEILKNQLGKFKLYLDSKIMKMGTIHITKEAGLFICRK